MRVTLIRSAREAKSVFEAVERLFCSTFGYRPDRIAWSQFYFANPYGDAIVALGWNGDQLVGHHALVPHVLTDANGKAYRYYLAMSLMLHPEYRGFPAFYRLVATTTEAARAEGAPFILGFPNKNSYALFQRAFGWKTLIETELYNWHPTKPSGPPRSIVALPHLRLTDEAGPPRDETYRQWRSLACPYHAELVNGRLAVIYKIECDTTLTVLDVLTERPEAAADDLGALATYAGARQVRMTGVHARTIGLDPATMERHTDYRLRLCYAPLTDHPPSIRFSLLLSDVF
ncbi:MAG: GNAT family N-acetyltransferase [Roseiflexus sp.]|nr:GNAT family N-acetyltransferase [Roseiflexus sp.]MCS7289789.1 GNAT family N-acetyltransferase [Roseiflexus sp.]MDW8145728.1 GNAT family N-acetyltransferase [Roseiflexaceae bacterium]MDW8232496.1 GNAT family N-acetyltransferase [Roseiflexaceae bacterium]